MYIACTEDGNVLAHSAPVAFGPVEATRSSGNVWHYNVILPSGDIDILTASVGTTTLHNPSAYAGDYQCGPEEPTCSVEVQPTDLLCLSTPLGNPGAECGYFGLLVAGKDDNLTGLTFTSTMDAYVAIVKSGSGGCGPGNSAYRRARDRSHARQ